MSGTKRRILILGAIGLLMIYYGLKLYRAPLESYTWTELLINYAAGFIRRGLVGRVAYYFSQFVSPVFFLTLTVILGYLIQLVLFFVQTRSVPDREWLLFALSPTGFLFTAYNFDAYGRKDVYLVVLFLLAYELIRRRVKLRIAFPLILVLYEIGALVHEYALFYFPFVLALLLVTESGRPRRSRLLIAAVGIVFLIGNLIWLFGLSNQYFDLDRIASSWEGLIPNYELTAQSGAMGWLGVPLKDGLQPVFDKLTFPQTFFSYLTAAALSLVPMALLERRFGIARAVRARLQGEPPFAWLAGAFALSTAAISVFSSDWGRLIYLYGMNLFPIGAVTIERFGLTDRAAAEPDEGYSRLSFALLLILFTSTWMVKMYVDGGHIALQGGAIYRLMDWIERIQAG